MNTVVGFYNKRQKENGINNACLGKIISLFIQKNENELL